VGTLPAETRVIDAFVTAAGVAYVDLSKEAAQKHPGGSRGELLSVYSVVNSLAANFPAVKRVQILVEDRQVPTLAGHVDLTRPLPADMTFLAEAKAAVP
jgi:spore germination protein GerM